MVGGLGGRGPARALADVRRIADHASGGAGIEVLLEQLQSFLPRCSDAGMALNNLERFVRSSSTPEAIVSSLSANPKTTDALLQILSTSQAFSEQMIQTPGLLAWLRGGAPKRDREAMIRDLQDELARTSDEDDQKRVIRRFRQRETLRIGYNDIVRDQPIELITLDISNLADACVEAALATALAGAVERFGHPLGPAGEQANIAVMAFGKLGGEELNYSSDIDLMFLYDFDGRTSGVRSISNAEFFARAATVVVRLLSDHSPMGPAYRVDMRLRPEGEQGPLARSLAATLGYYDTSGRTWERQALIKCRPIAGHARLGNDFLEAIRPFVFRRYLSASEIGEIKAMKRRIEQRTLREGADELDVKTGRGGIRDVEFVVQFLQLLHGGQYPGVRHPNTLAAIDRLESVGCLTARERGVMEDTYRFLRRIEHRLQILFDLQTHEMPRAVADRRALAVRMGYAPASPWEDQMGPAERFLADYRNKTEENRHILNHLLHDAFRDDSGLAVDPVVDLVLDPSPSPRQAAAALARYAFRDPEAAGVSLLALAREEIPFLSQARCRHFLAAISPRLLEALGKTPDPDMALVNLEKVSASLGAKAVLWELFSLNPPTLHLYVALCATSQFLSEILINNPGMVDDLMDSLVLDRPQSAGSIRSELEELCKGAEDLGMILLSFRNKEWVRIGTRDILAREPIREVLRELSDVAGAILAEAARGQWNLRVEKYGAPRRPGKGAIARWAVVALGKLGGRELTYQSDLDLVFIAETDGETSRGCPNERFFTDLAQRVLSQLDGRGSTPRIYKVDARLRPHGSSGPLVVSLEAFRDYYQATARAWERMALARARVVHATGGFGAVVGSTIKDLLMQPSDPVDLARQAKAMRERLASSRAPSHLKRGVGGLVDLEFIVQYLQLVHAKDHPEILEQNMWKAIGSLKSAGVISREESVQLKGAYTRLRTIESRLRIVRDQTGVELTDGRRDLERLAPRLHPECSALDEQLDAFHSNTAKHTGNARELFCRFIETAAKPDEPTVFSQDEGRDE